MMPPKAAYASGRRTDEADVRRLNDQAGLPCSSVAQRSISRRMACTEQSNGKIPDPAVAAMRLIGKRP